MCAFIDALAHVYLPLTDELPIGFSVFAAFTAARLCMYELNRDRASWRRKNFLIKRDRTVRDFALCALYQIYFNLADEHIFPKFE